MGASLLATTSSSLNAGHSVNDLQKCNSIYKLLFIGARRIRCATHEVVTSTGWVTRLARLINNPSRHLQHNSTRGLNYSMSAPTSNSIPPLDSQVAPSSPKMTSEQQDRAAMPPPSFIPRPREPSYTVQQLLAFTVRAAGPPSSSSCSFVKNQGCSPEHRPCRGNEEYEPILVKSLYAINPIIIAEFQARIFSIFAPSIPFLLNDSPAVPWAGGKIVSEDLVTTYVDSQVLCKAWRAVLKMVPVTRDYNLEIVKKTPVDVSLLLVLRQSGINSCLEGDPGPDVHSLDQERTSDPRHHRVHSSRRCHRDALDHQYAVHLPRFFCR